MPHPLCYAAAVYAGRRTRCALARFEVGVGRARDPQLTTEKKQLRKGSPGLWKQGNFWRCEHGGREWAYVIFIFP